MKKFMRENLKLIKLILAVMVLLVGTVVLIHSNEIRAQKLPELSGFNILLCNMENETYEYGYTGKEITPKVNRLVLSDAEGNVMIKYSPDITITGYSKNISLGYANIEVAISGYRGTLVIEKAFRIVPAQLQEVKVITLTNEKVELVWKKNSDAKGYMIYRSEDLGETYELLQQIESNDITTYTDEAVNSNAKYVYYICSYQQHGRTVYKGIKSNYISLYTTLDTPVLVGATCYGVNAIDIKWNAVKGASGYRIYRSLWADGEFACIGEITDGNITTFRDTACGLDETYYYYIQACQTINEDNYYGEVSNMVTCSYNLKNIIAVLRQYVGKPYIPNSVPSWKGWDCSGFVQLTYKTHFGISLPRNAASQSRVGQYVNKNDRSSWQPGDLLFYTEGNGISHVAVYLGDNLMIHALSQKHDTLIQDVDYYETWDGNNRLYCVRRYF